LAEAIARCRDRADCTIHARIDSLASRFEIGAKDDRSSSVDDGKALKTLELCGVGDGDHRPPSAQEYAARASLRVRAKCDRALIVRRRPERTNSRKRTLRVRDGHHLTAFDSNK